MPPMATEAKTLTLPATQRRTKRQPLWNVILLNDDDHTYEYVIGMMQQIFSHPAERGHLIAKKVDLDGRAVCLTTHKELAELKVEQIHDFGRDIRIASCAGSMSACMEPAECEGDDDLEGPSA